MIRRLLFIALLGLSLAPLGSFAAPEVIGCCYKGDKVDPTKFTAEDSTEKRCNDIAKDYSKVDWQAGKHAIGNECKVVTQRQIGDPTIFTPAVTIPGSEYVAGQSVALPESTLPLANYIIAIFKYSIGVIGILAVVVMMVGGVLWLTSGGNSEQIKQAKHWMGGSIAGLVLAFGSFLLLSMVNTSLVKFNITPVQRVDKVGIDVGCCKKTLADDKVTPSNPKITTQNLPKETCASLATYQVGPNGYESVVFFERQEAKDNTCVETLGCCKTLGANISPNTPGSGSGSAKNTNKFDCPVESSALGVVSFHPGKVASADGSQCVDAPTQAPTCIAQDSEGCTQHTDCCNPLKCAKGYAAEQPGSNDTKCLSCIPQWKWGCTVGGTDCCGGLQCVAQPEGNRCQ